MAKVTKIARLVASLEMESAQFRADMDASRKKLGGFKKLTKSAQKDIKAMAGQVRGLAGRMVNLTGVAGALTGALGGISLVALTAETMAANRETYAFAKALDMSVQELGALQYAATETTLTAEQMADKTKDIAEKIGTAYSEGAGEGAEALKKLGLRASDLIKMSPSEQLFQIANGLGAIGTQGEKIDIMEQFVSDGTLLLPLLENNGKRLRELTEEAIDLGVAVSDIDAESIERANRAWGRSKGVVQGLGNDIAVSLAPYLELSAKWLVENRKQTGGLGDDMQSMLKILVVSGAKTMDYLSRPASFIKSIGDDIWVGFKTLPPWAQEVGVIGALIGGKKGIAVLAAVSVLADDTKVTAEWFAAYTTGQISFGEWLTSGNDEARARLIELKESAGMVISAGTAGPSIVKSLFGDNGEPGDFEKKALEVIAAIEARRADIKPIALNVPAVVPENQVEYKGSPLAKLEAQLQKESNAFFVQQQTQEHRLVTSLAARVNMILTAYDEGIIPATVEGEDRKNRLLLEQEELFHQQKAALQDQANQQFLNRQLVGYQAITGFGDAYRANDLKGMRQHGLQALQLLGQNSRGMFKIYKAAAITNAIVAAYEGISKTLAAYPFPISGVMAAAQGVLAFAQVRSIQSQQFGGGSSSAPAVSAASAPVPSAPSAPSAPADVDGAPVPQQINIHVNGNLVDLTQLSREMRQYNIELEADVI